MSTPCGRRLVVPSRAPEVGAEMKTILAGPGQILRVILPISPHNVY
jgi:hypothetical protein